jgi:hypothetical protein
MRGALAASALVLILASSAEAQTFLAPAVPGPVTGDNPKRTLLVASHAIKSPTAASLDLATLESLAALHRLQTRELGDPGGAWLWMLISLAGTLAILALQRARHHRPHGFS